MSYSASTAVAATPDAVDPSAANGQAYPRDLDELHTRAVRWFEEAERGTIDERRESEQCRDYYDGYQWSKAEMDTLRSRNQPITTYNMIFDKVETICGLERKARTDPKAFPRTPREDDRADAATQSLRYMADESKFSLTRSSVYENMWIEGFGGCKIELKDDHMGGADPKPEWVPWDRIFRDPHSRMLDFSDARYKGIVIWMDRDQADEMYGDINADVCAQSFGPMGGTYDDRPGIINWQDSTRQRCRFVEMHWTERGVWWEMTFTKAGIVIPPMVSPIEDRDGNPVCRLRLQSARVDRDNKRYGPVRHQIPRQDAINKRHSKALHLLSVRQVITEVGAVENIDEARREVAKPDGVVVVNPGMRFDIEQTADLANGQLKLLEFATQEMQTSGPNASMMGNDSRELSGRAIIAQQAGGVMQNEPMADALRYWARDVYEVCWMAIRKYWTSEKWVRVTDDLGSIRWVGINRQVTLRDEIAGMEPEQQQNAMRMLQLVPNDPRLDQVIRTENDISDLDVDITVEEGNTSPTIAAEQFQTLVQMSSIQPGLIPGDVLIAASSLPNKQQLLDRMKAHQEQQAAMAAKQAPLIQANAEAEVAGKQAKAAADNALALERQHNVVHSIASVHEMHTNMLMPPPDAPSDVGGVAPELQNAQAVADIQKTAAETATEQARARDLHFAGVKKVAEVHAIMHPPAQKPAS